jgi:hypothetical protein
MSEKLIHAIVRVNQEVWEATIGEFTESCLAECAIYVKIPDDFKEFTPKMKDNLIEQYWKLAGGTKGQKMLEKSSYDLFHFELGGR